MTATTLQGERAMPVVTRAYSEGVGDGPILRLSPHRLTLGAAGDSLSSTSLTSPARSGGSRAWNAWQKGITIFLLLAIIVAGAILFMCLVGMIQFPGQPEVRAQWIEVTSQILNAIFTLNAVVAQGPRALAAWRTLEFTRARTRPERRAWISDWLEREYGGVVRLLGKSGPTVGGVEGPPNLASPSGRPSLSSLSSSESTTQGQPQPGRNLIPYYTPLRWWVATIALLNGQCLFQIPITTAMWCYPPETRMGWMVNAFLPLSFLCGAVGGGLQVYLGRQLKRGSERRSGPSSRPSLRDTSTVFLSVMNLSLASMGPAGEGEVVAEPEAAIPGAGMMVGAAAGPALDGGSAGTRPEVVAVVVPTPTGGASGTSALALATALALAAAAEAGAARDSGSPGSGGRSGETTVAGSRDHLGAALGPRC